MVTLLSSLIGFLGAMAPEVLNLFRERADRRHEREILDMQLRQQAAQQHEKLEEIRVGQLSDERQALYATWKSDVRWVDGLNGTVRPVLAYSFFLLYAATKLALVSQASPLPWLIWGEEDQAIFASIISFYFGQRAFARARK